MNFKLNYSNNGDIIGKIGSRLISLNEQPGKDEIHIKGIEPCPNINKERDVLFIFGQSGSGKSYYVMMYSNNYKKIYPKRPIYCFSTVGSDGGSLDKIKSLKRVDLNLLLQDNEVIETENFKNSLIIFDDVDNISDKKLKNLVWKYMNNFLQTGRHYNISVCITFHVGCAGNETKMILNEATSITYFPITIGARALKYICDSYLGLSKKQLEKLKKIESRWITINKTYPKTITTENQAYILRND